MVPNHIYRELKEERVRKRNTLMLLVAVLILVIGAVRANVQMEKQTNDTNQTTR